MAYENPSGSLLHAAQFASLMLQTCEHLFPGQKLFQLSEDQRRVLANETRVLLLRARWIVDSKEFAEQLASPLAALPEAPAGTVLGRPLPASATPKPPSGQYA